MNSCPKCGHTHIAGDAVALSRFTGITGYRTPDGEIHATREDAQQWLCEQRLSASQPTSELSCGPLPAIGLRPPRDGPRLAPEAPQPPLPLGLSRGPSGPVGDDPQPGLFPHSAPSGNLVVREADVVPVDGDALGADDLGELLLPVGAVNRVGEGAGEDLADLVAVHVDDSIGMCVDLSTPFVDKVQMRTPPGDRS